MEEHDTDDAPPPISEPVSDRREWLAWIALGAYVGVYGLRHVVLPKFKQEGNGGGSGELRSKGKR